MIASFSNMDIYYEDLVQCTDMEINRIGQLCQIPSLTVENKEDFLIEKLNKKPIREIISNYSEVEDFLCKNNLEEFIKSEV